MLKRKSMYVCAIMRSMHRAGPATCTQPGPTVCMEASTTNRSRSGSPSFLCTMEVWRARWRLGFGFGFGFYEYALSTTRSNSVPCGCGPRDDPVRSCSPVTVTWPPPLRPFLEFHLASNGQDAPLCTTSRRGPQDPLLARSTASAQSAPRSNAPAQQITPVHIELNA
ncbi:hypothetical protein P171DRAFT_105062 [Karstenula rhodostoma CBS 690.94]|uniref:Uncharacterized protein n=1 Tax=Karstenula rhodostoma CBS 690.94 TaxID=1392251 RepID=A0A9P4U6Z3_9PLEO|nr:hypothetical protein P171DRAFT_105062 [Karstenula rhodostoma CBS 690.94]